MLLSLLLAAAPMALPSNQTIDNPFRKGTSATPTARRRGGSKRTATRPSGDTGSNVYYANCTAARAAGAAPVMRGEPGYSRKLDRDNDGVGCE